MLRKFEFSLQISEKHVHIQFHENTFSAIRAVPFGHADGRTNRQTWRSSYSHFAISRPRLKSIFFSRMLRCSHHTPCSCWHRMDQTDPPTACLSAAIQWAAMPAAYDKNCQCPTNTTVPTHHRLVPAANWVGEKQSSGNQSWTATN